MTVINYHAKLPCPGMGTFPESVAPVRSAVALDTLLLMLQGSEILCLVAPSKIFVALLCYSATGCPPLIQVISILDELFLS